MTLADVTIGQTATVLAIQGADEIAVRLMELGLIPGVDLRLIGKAPLGDPLELELRGYRLSLRKSEAARVSVTSSS